MSITIKQAIEALKIRIADAYTAIVAKGGTLPATQDSANLPAAIASIPSEGLDMAGFVAAENATMATIMQRGYSAGIVSVDNSTITRFGQYFSMSRMYNLASIRFANVVDHDNAHSCFSGCRNLRTASLPSMRIMPDGMFDDSGLQEIEAPLLTTLSGDACFYGTGIKRVDFPLLTGITFQTFNSCSSLRVLNVPSITTFGGSCVNACVKLIDIVCGAAFTGNVNFYSWNPTQALRADSTSLVDDSETFRSNLEKLLYNIREHLAANLRSNVTATITFSANVYNAIQADAATVAAFPASWTIASA